MMDELPCLVDIQKCIKRCRSPGQEKWRSIFVKLQEYLRETSVKRRLATVDVLWKDISALTRREDFSSQLDEEFLLSLTSVSCTIYVCSLGNLRLCQRLKKILNFLYEAKPQFVKSEVKRITEELLSSATHKLVSAVEKVCQLIDVLELGKQCVDELFAKFFMSVSCCLDSFCQELQKHSGQDGLSHMASNPEQCQTIIKAVLKTFQYFPAKVHSMLYNNPFEVLETLISNVLSILFNKALPKECLLLCGTAVGLLLGITVDRMSSVPIREMVAQLLVSAGATCVECRSLQGRPLMIGHVRVSLPVSEYKPITQLAIIMGILKSQQQQVLLAVDCDTLQKVPEGRECTVMEGLLFHTTYALCRESKNSPVHYVAFEAMKQWLLSVQQSIQQHSFPWLTSSDSYHTRLLLDLIWDNLEDSIEGVPALAIALFSLLLKLHEEEESKNVCPEGKFYISLADKALALPWHVKGRYGLICSLLPFVGLQKVQFIEKQPPLLDDLVHCLGVNQLAPSSTTTLKNFLEWGRKGAKCKQPGTEGQTEFIEMWEKAWKAALFNALTSKERLMQQNACMHWLPCVLKSVPDSFHPLLMELKKLFEGGATDVNSPDRTCVFAAYLAVLKAGRSLALLKTCELDEAFLLQGLTHLQDDIRATALSVISFTTRTAEPLSALEQKLLKQFLPHNLNTACASFRQTLFVSMKKILARTRDSSLILVKQHYPLISQGKSIEESAITYSLPEELRTMFDFVSWLFNLAMDCFFPGSSYQRQKTGMQLLVAVLDIFTAKWQPDKKKGQPPAACQTLVSLAQHFGYFTFFASRNVAILCGCVESPYSDIRDAAVELLQDHFPWPLLLTENDPTGSKSASLLMHKALKLVRSPKVQDCESGSSLFLLISSKYCLEFGCQFDSLREELKCVIPGSKPSFGDKLSSAVRLFQQLLLELQGHVKAAQEDLRLASQRSPGHGLSLAIAQVLEATIDKTKTVQELQSWPHLQSMVQETVETAVHVIHFMLDVLGGTQNTKTVGGASFAVIGETLNEMLSSSLTLSDEATEPDCVQSHRDLVLSCCWLHIKCASHLLAVISEAAIKVEDHSQENPGPTALISEESWKLIGETAKGVIVQCRHQGVVQSCRGSFVKICRNLFHSSRPSLQLLPKQWLDQMLTTISSPGSLSSVTRRSAGLPVLFTCVLSCEPSSYQRALLKHCMEDLLQTAQSPLPCDIDHHKDLPQVHAINILKALYQDASLGSAVLQYAPQGTSMAVAGFASSSWAVRNASMQLFGSVVNRMLGQKRGTDDNSEMNTISARDFFNRYPVLREFFLNYVRGASDAESGQPSPAQFSRPELFPILTLLSKLHPTSETDERASSLLSEFVPPVMSLSSCPIYAVRAVAAKALVPFIPTEGLLDKVQELVSLLPGPSQQFTQNFLHGTLLQIRVLLDTVRWSVTSYSCGRLFEELLKKTWIGTPSNPCALTRASFLGILVEFGPLIAADSESGFRSLESIIIDSVIASQTKGVFVGEAHLQRVLVRSSLQLEFDCSRSKGPQKTPAIGHGNILSTLLSSADHEQRLSALQYMSELLSRNGKSLLPNSVQLDLVNLLNKETDNNCILLALDVFVEVFSNFDGCSLLFDDLRTLWDLLTSFAGQGCGVSVAGKSIVACSVLLERIIALEVKENALGGMLCHWCQVIETCCSWGQDEVLRLGAVEGLKLCGATVLCYVLRCTAGQGNELSEIVEAAISVLRSTLCFLQDEEETIRKRAAEFVALLSEVTGDLQLRSVTCPAAVEHVLQFMVQHFWYIPSCWVTMETMIRGEQPIEDVLKDYLHSRQMLYEQEDSNLYAEPVVVAKLVERHFKIIISKMLSSDDVHLSVKSAFSQWFVAGCDRLAADLQALTYSGIKEYGSLPNPKPFTVRFRVMCLADVLLCVAHSGLECNPFNKEINSVIEQLVAVLEQIIQGRNTAHPWLTEFASTLMFMVQQTRQGQV